MAVQVNSPAPAFELQGEVGRPVFLPTGLHPHLTHGDPRALPAGERIRFGRRAGPRGQHGQQVFPPGVGKPRTGGVDLDARQASAFQGHRPVGRPGKDSADGVSVLWVVSATSVAVRCTGG
jgi:hypothetical protein